MCLINFTITKLLKKLKDFSIYISVLLVSPDTQGSFLCHQSASLSDCNKIYVSFLQQVTPAFREVTLLNKNNLISLEAFDHCWSIPSIILWTGNLSCGLGMLQHSFISHCNNILACLFYIPTGTFIIALEVKCFFVPDIISVGWKVVSRHNIDNQIPLILDLWILLTKTSACVVLVNVFFMCFFFLVFLLKTKRWKIALSLEFKTFSFAHNWMSMKEALFYVFSSVSCLMTLTLLHGMMPQVHVVCKAHLDVCWTKAISSHFKVSYEVICVI